MKRLHRQLLLPTLVGLGLTTAILWSSAQFTWQRGFDEDPLLGVLTERPDLVAILGRLSDLV